MVTGSSGFVGQPLVRLLSEKGRTVVSVYRHRLPDSLEGAYPVCSDLSSPELMAAPLRGVETVLHLAWDGGLAGPDGPLPEDPLGPDVALTKNLRAFKNLITAMERAGTRRLVFLSALGAAGKAQSPFLREKYQAELMLLNSRIPEKVILRSSVVWGGQGSADRFLTSIRRVLRYVIYPVPRRHGRLSPLHVKDLAALLVAATEASTKLDVSLMEVNGGESYLIDDLLKLVSSSVVRRTQFPLRGVLGESLLPWLERNKDGRVPRLQQFLCLAQDERPETLRQGNPLATILPDKVPGFKERLAN
jgi:nucleoside-diphosphate-sugar epimerase